MPSAVEPTVDQRIVEAAARLPAHGAVTGWAALRWHQASWFEGTDHTGSQRPVPLALDDRHSVRGNSRLLVSQEILPPGVIRRVRGLRLTDPRWSVAFEMRKAASDEEAVVAFEMAAFQDLVSIAELRDFVESHLWVRQGVQRIRDLLHLLEENSWSPMEPVMRMTWLATELGRPRANRPVFDLNGRFVGTPDGFDPVAGVYGQYDGALHLAGGVRHGDVAKEASYRALGLEGVTMMAGDVGDRGPFVARLRAAYARAERRPVQDRRWLAEPPGWWVPTWTVEQRRALTSYERSRFLRYRPAA